MITKAGRDPLLLTHLHVDVEVASPEAQPADRGSEREDPTEAAVQDLPGKGGLQVAADGDAGLHLVWEKARGGAEGRGLLWQRRRRRQRGQALTHLLYKEQNTL